MSYNLHDPRDLDDDGGDWFADDEADGLAALMGDLPGGENGGRRHATGGDPHHRDDADADSYSGTAEYRGGRGRHDDGGRRPTGTDEPRAIALDAAGKVAADFLRDGGWSAIDTTHHTSDVTRGYASAGMTTHRGVLHPEDYVDEEALQALVLEQFGGGETIETIRACYRRGPCPERLLKRRARLDKKFMRVVETGGNVTQLAQALGIGESSMDRAIRRARDARDAARS